MSISYVLSDVQYVHNVEKCIFAKNSCKTSQVADKEVGRMKPGAKTSIRKRMAVQKNEKQMKEY